MAAGTAAFGHSRMNYLTNKLDERLTQLIHALQLANTHLKDDQVKETTCRELNGLAGAEELYQTGLCQAQTTTFTIPRAWRSPNLYLSHEVYPRKLSDVGGFADSP